MKQTIRYAGIGLLCLLAALGGNAVAANLEEIGAIDRYDSVRKVISINGREYRVVDQAADVLAAYLEANGIGSLGGKVAMFHSDGNRSRSPFIDVIDVIGEDGSTGTAPVSPQ